MATLKIENRTAKKPPEQPKKPKKPSLTDKLQDQLVRLADLLGLTIEEHAAQLAIRDATIAELQGQVRNQAEAFGEFRAAYAAQGKVAEALAERLTATVDLCAKLQDRFDGHAKVTDGLIGSLRIDLDNCEANSANLDNAQTSAILAQGEIVGKLSIRAEGTAAAVDALQKVHDSLAGELGELRAEGVRRHAELGALVNELDQAQTTRAEKIAEELAGMHNGARESVLQARAEVVSMLGQAHEERTRENAALAAKLATVEDKTTIISGAVSNANTSLQATELALTGRANQLATEVEQLTQRTIVAIEAQEKTLRAWTADVVDDALDAFNKRSAEIERAAGELAVRVERIDKDCDLLATETEQRVAGVGEQLVQTHNVLQAEVAGVRSGLQELRDRLRSTVSKLPKTLLVNSDGDLVVIDGNGEPDKRGHVRGKAGRDGAELLDATIRDGCLVLQMTNGRKVVTENLLLQVVQEVQATVVSNLQKTGIPDKQIAALFGKRPAKSQRAKNEGQVEEPAQRRATRRK